MIRASSSITICEFLSTPSARRATHQDCPEKGCNKNFYPRPPRGGRRYLARPERHDLRISIHALREEGDWSGSIRWAQHSHFYPRPPRGGRLTQSSLLQQTISNFYPRPPRGGRLHQRGPSYPPQRFLSTPSARRATAALCTVRDELEISIHALREEGDVPQRNRPSCTTNFYPRPPRGGRQCRPQQHQHRSAYFYPRPPRGGRRVLFLQHKRPPYQFLSTPSARRATALVLSFSLKADYFYPRPPRGGRQSRLHRATTPA